ncbi:MAG TPA: HD domain-containing phosphohydrolase [Phycisphaerae bacterium]|nr:HD domain-containing phosphohydrolase [Phycisphaerae bacterium]
MRVLVVDGDRVALTLIRNTLTNAGYEVLITDNCEEALSIVNQGLCHLVVTDWDVDKPDSGLHLCQFIRREEFWGYVYLILLTSHNEPADRVRGLTAGADDFIGKPFDPDELVARVRSGERVLSMDTRDVAIFAMAKLAESRDPETGMHLERVQGYSRLLAQDLAWSPRFQSSVTANFIRWIYLTSPLHDIGKVAIPDYVLLKPGRLTDREFALMKTHTTLGANTIDIALRKFPDAEFLRIAREITASHHERIDGTGYPTQVRGEEIPLSGRIVAVADVYDALTSRRLYKDAFSHEIARSMIVAGGGTQFDRDVVQAFLRNEDAFQDIRDRFSEAPPEIT